MNKYNVDFSLVMNMMLHWCTLNKVQPKNLIEEFEKQILSQENEIDFTEVFNSIDVFCKKNNIEKDQFVEFYVTEGDYNED